jgi:hypothetical protein
LRVLPSMLSIPSYSNVVVIPSYPIMPIILLISGLGSKNWSVYPIISHIFIKIRWFWHQKIEARLCWSYSRSYVH